MIYSTNKQYFIATTRKNTQNLKNLKIFYTFA